MKKLLKLNEVLILTVGGLLDAFQEMNDPFNLFSNYYMNFYGFIPPKWKKSNFHILLAKALKTELISKREENGQVFFQLTSKGKSKIKRRFPLLDFQKKNWDGCWRLVIFDIKELSRHLRDRLRRKLRELGLGMIQKSVWLTPHNILVDLEEWLDHMGIGNEIILIETKSLLTKDLVSFTNKIWGVDELNSRYKKIYLELSAMEKEIVSHPLSSSLQAKFTDLLNEYIALILNDPFLPKNLLPKDWHYLPVSNLIKKLKIAFSKGKIQK